MLGFIDDDAYLLSRGFVKSLQSFRNGRAARFAKLGEVEIKAHGANVNFASDGVAHLLEKISFFSCSASNDAGKAGPGVLSSIGPQVDIDRKDPSFLQQWDKVVLEEHRLARPPRCS